MQQCLVVYLGGSKTCGIHMAAVTCAVEMVPVTYKRLQLIQWAGIVQHCGLGGLK